MFDNLTKRLSDLVKTISGNAALTESNIQDALREVRIALLEADVALSVVKNFIDEIKVEALGQKVLASLTPGQALIGVVHAHLIKLMGDSNRSLDLNCAPPAVILMAGLQGAGKTTTTAKLALWLKEKNKKKVLLVSTDIYRPAAIEQLQILANNLQIEAFPANPTQMPLAIAANALAYAKAHYFDVLLVDTAGRLTIDEQMMTEIKELQHQLQPIETLFIADAMLGQDAVNTAKAFDDALSLTGIILTKMDGDARGGAALSIRYITGKPIKFIGMSEKINGLEPFHPERLASRILGMGDVLSLIEEVKSNIGEEESKKLLNKVKSGRKFDLNELKMQFEQLGNMGGMHKILDKLPTQLTNFLPNNINDTMAKKNIAIINSMTPEERANPDILKASRKKRIASGCGLTVQAVNQLLKQYEEINTMMKRFSGADGIAKFMRNFGKFMPTK